ncbi:MAG: hypothetical protein JWQ54_1653 [Mucilaginibacter sp.]|nr:hypothetical protein [Mucilaginibacter sp.]
MLDFEIRLTHSRPPVSNIAQKRWIKLAAYSGAYDGNKKLSGLPKRGGMSCTPASVPLLQRNGWNAVEHAYYQYYNIFTTSKCLIIKCFKYLYFRMVCCNLFIISVFHFCID